MYLPGQTDYIQGQGPHLLGAGTCLSHSLLTALVPEVSPAAQPGLGQWDCSVLFISSLPA